MPAEYEIQRVEHGDPEQCQHVVAGKYQCRNKRHPGARNCFAHCGGSELNKLKNQEMSNYRLSKYKGRLQEKKNSPEIKSLRDEIGILRMVLEEQLESCSNEVDLILHADRISDLVVKIEKLVTSCHKLEERLGITLDQEKIREFVDALLQILIAELEPSVAERIATKIAEYAEGFLTTASKTDSD